MLSQANINKILKEKVLSKTAGAAHMSKYAENWLSADNYSNLKNVGMGVGTAASTYALSSLLPNAKKNRLARLAASVAAGGVAGHYGKDIRDFDYGKLNPWRGNTAKPERAEAGGFVGPPTPEPKVQPVTIPPEPKVLPVTIPPMPKVQPVTPATKANALSGIDWGSYFANPQPTLLEKLLGAYYSNRS